jgi:tetratricopeptide (TPR) repeat protein
LTYILILTAAVASLVVILSDRVVRFQRWKWPLGVLIAAVGIVVPTIGFFGGDKTEKAVHDEADRLQAYMECRFDSLDARLGNPATLGEPDSIYRAETRELAECLEGIAQTALEKGMAAVGLERYEEALTHLAYARQAVSGDSAKLAQTYYGLGFAHYRMGQSPEALEDCDNGL